MSAGGSGDSFVTVLCSLWHPQRRLCLLSASCVGSTSDELRGEASWEPQNQLSPGFELHTVGFNDGILKVAVAVSFVLKCNCVDLKC